MRSKKLSIGYGEVRITVPDIERRGAIALLSACWQFMPAQAAVQLLESGQSPTAAGQALSHSLARQAEHIQHLAEELAREKSQRELLEAQAERWYADPLQRQIIDAQHALDETNAQLQEAQARLQAAQEVLECERQAHAREVRQLQAQIHELNRLVASQHKRLEELTGSETPE
jgi:chromosome segregation ATPase